MDDRDYVTVGIKVTQVLVRGLGFASELDDFIDACQEQLDIHEDEAARYALDTALAVRRFRDDVRELTSKQVAAVMATGAP